MNEPAGPIDKLLPGDAPRRIAYRVSRTRHAIVAGTLRPVVRLFLLCLFGLRLFGRNRAPRRQPDGSRTGILLLSNHQSYPDPIFIGAAFPYIIHFMARENVFRGPMDAFLRSVGTFPVARGERDDHAIRHSISLLKDGDGVLVFGEGTRTPDGSVYEIRAGSEMMARRGRALIMPMVIDGAFQSMPRHRPVFDLQARSVYLLLGEPEEPKRPARDAGPSRMQERLQTLLQDARALRRRAGDGGIPALATPALQAIFGYARFWLLPYLLWRARRKARRQAGSQPHGATPPEAAS